MQIGVNGLIQGMVLAILALSFAIVYIPTRIFYIALGGVYTFVPFVTWQFIEKGNPWFFALIIGGGAGIILSVLTELLNHSNLEKRNASPGAHLISSLGIFIVIVQISAILWGNETKVLRKGLDKIHTLGGVIITNAQLIALLVSLFILVLFFIGIYFSGTGLKLRALADNPCEYALRAYNIRTMRIIVFAISGFLCSIASLLNAYDIGFDPNSSLNIILLAVVAVLIGGRSSFWGAVLGAIFLGITRTAVVWFLSARWQDAVTFLILVLFLFFKPEGIVSQKLRLEERE